MKQNMFMMTLITVMSCNVTFILADTNDWQRNALLIQDTLSSLTGTLSEDASCFDSITQEIDHLVDYINAQDLSEQDLIQKLGTQFTDLVQAYYNVLEQEQNVQYQNTAAIQQLKITLATVQSSIQAQIDQLNIQSNDSELLLQQLTDAYNLAVADNQEEATDLLAILRSVCDAYAIMVEEKQISVDGLNDILSALSNHIANATAGFDQLNAVINQ